MPQFLVIRELSKAFGPITAIGSLSLELNGGEKCCLIGPTGSGKTTLLRLIAGFEQPDQGEIFLKGKLVSSNKILVPPYQRKGGMVFQNQALWPHMTVLKHLLLTMDSKLNRKEKKGKAEEIIDLTGLAPYSKSYPAMLSGGQRQKLAIARMMSSFTEIALLDEPFTHLDPDSKDAMRSLVQRWIEINRITCIMTTHDPLEDFSYFDSIAVMSDGNMVYQDKPEDGRQLFEYINIGAQEQITL